MSIKQKLILCMMSNNWYNYCIGFKKLFAWTKCIKIKYFLRIIKYYLCIYALLWRKISWKWEKCENLILHLRWEENCLIELVSWKLEDAIERTEEYVWDIWKINVRMGSIMIYEISIFQGGVMVCYYGYILRFSYFFIIKDFLKENRSGRIFFQTKCYGPL